MIARGNVGAGRGKIITLPLYYPSGGITVPAYTASKHAVVD